MFFFYEIEIFKNSKKFKLKEKHKISNYEEYKLNK